MGWWRTGEGEDRISDEGADCLMSTLRELSDRAVEKWGARHDLAEVLSIAGAALRQRPDALISDPDSLAGDPATVQVLMRDRPPVLVPLDSAAPDPYAVHRLYDAFDDVASDYLGSELARLPRLGELLALLAFVLRVEAAPYLRDAPAEIPIDRIVLVASGGA